MSKPTHAHLTFALSKGLSFAEKEQTKRQKEYYMGAKLLEIGVQPQAALYRWSLETNPQEEVWTYSAFWGESKEQLLSGQYPLEGAELLDCARANASQGLAIAAQLCGYGEQISQFEAALQDSAQRAGLSLQTLADLSPKPGPGLTLAPETDGSL